MLEALTSLNLGEQTSLIAHVRVLKWGSELQLDCLYDPIEKLPYTLTFLDCQEIKWNFYSLDDLEDLEADLIDIQLGESNHQKPAIIYTDIFEIRVWYGKLAIHKKW